MAHLQSNAEIRAEAAGTSIVRRAAQNLADYKYESRNDGPDNLPAIPSTDGRLASKVHRSSTDGRRCACDCCELLSRCFIASKLTAAPRHTPDDRTDVAATIAARHSGWQDRRPTNLDGTPKHGTPSQVLGYIHRAERGRIESTLPTLSELCGQARNLFRAIDAQRKHLADKELIEGAIEANTSVGTGTDDESMRLADELRAIGRQDAEDLAGRLARRLGVSDRPDSAPWTACYSIVAPYRVKSDDRCAEDRGVTVEVYRRKRDRGAAAIKERYTVADVLAELTPGAFHAYHLEQAPTDIDGRPVKRTTRSKQLADAVYLIGGEDFTREARHSGNFLPEPVREIPAAEVTSVRLIGPPVRPVDRTADMKRAAYRWARREYEQRLVSVGLGADLAAERDRAPRNTSTESTLLDALTD